MAPTEILLELPTTRIAHSSPLLEAKNVRRVLGTGDLATEVLRGVNLAIHGGEYVSIVGSSGSGKSTLLYLLGGLDRPTTADASGRLFDPPSLVYMEGQDTALLSERQLALLRNRLVGFVFQFHYLLEGIHGTGERGVADVQARPASPGRSDGPGRRTSTQTWIGRQTQASRQPPQRRRAAARGDRQGSGK